MTRGKSAVILDNEVIWTSTEFNWNMYHSDGGYGKEIMNVYDNYIVVTD